MENKTWGHGKTCPCPVCTYIVDSGPSPIDSKLDQEQLGIMAHYILVVVIEMHKLGKIDTEKTGDHFILDHSEDTREGFFFARSLLEAVYKNGYQRAELDSFAKVWDNSSGEGNATVDTG